MWWCQLLLVQQLSLHSTWKFSSDSFWLVFHQHGLCKVLLSKKSLGAQDELLSVDGSDYLETLVFKTILTHILQWALTLSERDKSNDNARKVSQCHKSNQYQRNTCIAINKSICLEIKITVSKNIVMISTLEMLNTNRGKNAIALEKKSRGFLFLFHTIQKQTTSGLMLCSPEAAFYSVAFYMLERGLNKNRLGLPNYTWVYWNSGFIRLTHLPDLSVDLTRSSTTWKGVLCVIYIPLEKSFLAQRKQGNSTCQNAISIRNV